MLKLTLESVVCVVYWLIMDVILVFVIRGPGIMFVNEPSSVAVTFANIDVVNEGQEFWVKMLLVIDEVTVTVVDNKQLVCVGVIVMVVVVVFVTVMVVVDAFTLIYSVEMIAGCGEGKQVYVEVGNTSDVFCEGDKTCV